MLVIRFILYQVIFFILYKCQEVEIYDMEKLIEKEIENLEVEKLEIKKLDEYIKAVMHPLLGRG
jgi:hypothetical protein